jgi:hypothetical protein
MGGNVKLLESDSLIIDIRNRNWPLVISFASLGDKFQFRGLFQDLQVNCIYFRDLKHNWYLNGVPGAGASVSEISNFLSNQMQLHAFTRVISIGASAGGFAALLFGSLMRVDQILAFSPQTFVDKMHRTFYYDYRWRDRVKQIYDGEKSNREFLDVKPFIKCFPNRVDLFYDNSHRLDGIHCRRLKFENINHLKFPDAGHNLIKELKQSGKLHRYINDALTGV